MADELDKTTAEADETTTEPEYQPLHPLVKWGIPAGILVVSRGDCAARYAEGNAVRDGETAVYVYLCDDFMAHHRSADDAGA